MMDLNVRPANPADLPHISELIASAFSRDDPDQYRYIREQWLHHRPNKPGFIYERSRVGELNGQIITHALIERYVLNYGTARLRVGGIGWVCTAAEYRGRGYAATVTHDALAYMAEQGAHLALLNGSTYHTRFGFSPVWPYYEIEMRSSDAANLPMTMTLRPATHDDIPQMAALYDQHWGGRVAFYRTPEMWHWRLRAAYHPPVVVDDGHGRVAGYLKGRFRPELVEVVANSRDAAMTLIAQAGRWHEAAGERHIKWLAPPDDAFVVYARRLLPVILSARYKPDGGWMARLIDTRALVDELVPELVAQARSTFPGFAAAMLVFDCQSDVVRIGLKDRPTSFCELNHRDFIQVMFGSLRPRLLAAQVRLTPESVRLLEILFPPRMAALGGWDWF